ncbi:MAG: DUF58 domain-containing protein [Gammaproteobacteria bacterium]|nr:DUF58 domain-containing protein [Gammaproteobacteria bacterium]
MLRGAYVSLQDLVELSKTSSARARSRRSKSPMSGERVSVHRGRGVDFEEVRLYQPGDDVRNIDWKVTARKQLPHTKVYTEERERPTLIVVDQSRSMFLGSNKRLKSVAAAEIAARIAWQTLAERDRVGGLVFGTDQIDVIKPFRNGTAVVKVLSAVVNANRKLNVLDSRVRSERNKSERWKSLLLRLRRIAPAHHRIFVVSDFAALEIEAVEELLNRGHHHEMQAIHVYDEIERTLPPADFYNVTNGVSHVMFHSGRQSLRDEYSTRFSSKINELRSLCIRSNVSFTSISTDNELDSFNFH